MKHKGKMALAAFVGLGVAAYWIVPSVPGTLRITSDDNGMRAWGTGVIRYYYADHPDQPQLVERFSRSRPVRSEWFKPDGTLVMATDWGPDWDGWYVYLRDDGSISRKMYFVHGQCAVNDPSQTCYAPDGRQVSREEYDAGEESNWGQGGPRKRQKATREVHSAR